MNLNEANLIDLGSYDYDDPKYRPVENWFFEPAETLGLIEEEDYVIVYDVFHLRPYDKQPMVLIYTILVTYEAACRLEDYFGQKARHYSRLIHEIETTWRKPEDDTFVYDSSKYQPVGR